MDAHERFRAALEDVFTSENEDHLAELSKTDNSVSLRSAAHLRNEHYQLAETLNTVVRAYNDAHGTALPDFAADDRFQAALNARLYIIFGPAYAADPDGSLIHALRRGA